MAAPPAVQAGAAATLPTPLLPPTRCCPWHRLAARLDQTPAPRTVPRPHHAVDVVRLRRGSGSPTRRRPRHLPRYERGRSVCPPHWYTMQLLRAVTVMQTPQRQRVGSPRTVVMTASSAVVVAAPAASHPSAATTARLSLRGSRWPASGCGVTWSVPRPLPGTVAAVVAQAVMPRVATPPLAQPLCQHLVATTTWSRIPTTPPFPPSFAGGRNGTRQPARRACGGQGSAGVVPLRWADHVHVASEGAQATPRKPVHVLPVNHRRRQRARRLATHVGYRLHTYQQPAHTVRALGRAQEARQAWGWVASSR